MEAQEDLECDRKLSPGLGSTLMRSLGPFTILKTVGSSTLDKTLVDNNSNTYTIGFTQNGTTDTGTTSVTFLPGTLTAISAAMRAYSIAVTPLSESAENQAESGLMN
jgi:hypothetical protein